MAADFSINHNKYINRNKELAKINVFSGKALQSWHKSTVWTQMIKYFGPTHWLDYGCGPAYAYQEEGRVAFDTAQETGSTFTLYDPCHPPYDTFPTQSNFPGVICVDVIEHIPETDTKATLDYLFNVCTDWMFLFISTKEGAHPFVDGPVETHESTHCTLKTRDEWVKIINRYAETADFPVVLTTDYENNTFLHSGKSMTYNDWNMPVELQEIIKEQREHFVKSSPEIAEESPWHLTESVFSV